MSGERTARRVALVTGGARGIGGSIAEHLAREGMEVALGDIQEEGAAAGVLEAVRAAGADPLYCRADVSDAGSRAALLEAVRERFGALHVLVNNAGVAPAARADLLEASEESFERVLRINLQGPYFLTQAAARWMIAQRGASPGYRGCVINISSVSAEVASTTRGEYCVSKAGVSMATRLWAARLGEHDIPVYEVRPGVIRTEMTRAVAGKYDALIAGGLCVQARWGLPEDVGRACAMLARGDLPFSTGQVIRVDGGLTLPRL